MLGALSKNLRQMLYERLADSGVVRAERSRILGVVPVHRWPAQDASHEAEVRRLVTQALVHQVAPDTRIAALIALLRARVRGQDRRPPGSTACPSGNSGHGRRRSPRATGHHRPSARRSRRRWPRSSPPPPQPPSPPPRPLARPAAVGRAHDRTDNPVRAWHEWPPRRPVRRPYRRVGARLSTWASCSWLAASRGYRSADEPPTDRIFMHRRSRSEFPLLPR